jgi:hypothetical protein
VGGALADAASKVVNVVVVAATISGPLGALWLGWSMAGLTRRWLYPLLLATLALGLSALLILLAFDDDSGGAGAFLVGVWLAVQGIGIPLGLIGGFMLRRHRARRSGR